jgi:hypothetical protein
MRNDDYQTIIIARKKKPDLYLKAHKAACPDKNITTIELVCLRQYYIIIYKVNKQTYAVSRVLILRYLMQKRSGIFGTINNSITCYKDKKRESMITNSDTWKYLIKQNSRNLF